MKSAIHAAIVGIMSAVGSVGKSGANERQNYKFRKIDDVYAALQKLMAENGVYTTSEILKEQSEERKSSSGGALIYRILTMRYTFWCKEDGSFVQTTVIGEGMDGGDKAANKAMAVAHKYALCQIFVIPTEDPKDPENDSPQVALKVDSKEIYKGLDDQKAQFKAIANKHGIITIEDLQKLSAGIVKLKCPMDKLEESIKEWLVNPYMTETP